MNKRLVLLLGLLWMLTSNISYAQVDNNGWPPATVEYFKQPTVLLGAHVTPVLGLPYYGVFWGLDANIKVANRLYVNGGFLAPLLDASTFNGGSRNYAFSGGIEFAYRNKYDMDNFDLTISSSESGGVVTKRYRDYKARVREQSILRLGIESYLNSRYSPNILTTLEGFDSEEKDALLMPDGNYFQHSGIFNCYYLYLGFGRKAANYMTLKMSDYVETDKFNYTLTGFIDFFYAPSLALDPITYNGQQYVAADYYRLMPYGMRLGFEAYRGNTYPGFYVKTEFGMMPGVGIPLYLKFGIGFAPRFTKYKSIGNTLKK